MQDRDCTHPDIRIRRISSRAETPFAAAKALLKDHVDLMHARMLACGGPDFDQNAHAEAFWARFDSVLPPNGHYFLASDQTGRLVGTASLRRISPTAGELKHLYVRPEARGLGLGRALNEQRMKAARTMGLKSLYTDTFAVNPEVRGLYESLGFKSAPPFSQSATSGISPELVERMLFFRYDFPEQGAA